MTLFCALPGKCGWETPTVCWAACSLFWEVIKCAPRVPVLGAVLSDGGTVLGQEVGVRGGDTGQRETRIKPIRWDSGGTECG